MSDAKMPEIPQSVFDQIDARFEKFLFLKSEKHGRRKTYTCTACHETFVAGVNKTMSPADWALFTVKHNDKAECPKCGTVGTVKNIGKLKNLWRLNQRQCVAVFMATSPDDVWIRCVMCDRDYDQMYYRGRTSVTETNRYHLTPGDATHQIISEYHGEWVPETLKSPFQWHHGIYKEIYPFELIRQGPLYIDDTFLKYHGFEHSGLEDRQFIRWLCNYAELPQLEMLAKLGHANVARDIVMSSRREYRTLLDFDAKKPWDLFRLTREDYNTWKNEKKGDFQLYKIFRRIKGSGKRDFEVAEEINKGCRGNLKDCYSFVADCRRVKANVREIVRYLRRQQDISGGECWHCPGATIAQIYDTWGDTMRMSERLGCMSSFKPMPKDIKAEHNRLLAIINAAEAKKRRERDAAERKRYEAEQKKLAEKYKDVAEIYAKIRQRYEWKNEKYAIRVPEGYLDLIDEGNELHHCITRAGDRYIDRIKRHESYLFFLRKTERPDKPFYTIEAEPCGTVRQVRTKWDEQGPDIDDIRAFLAEWQKQIAARMKDEDKEKAAESRAARQKELAELRETKTKIRTGTLQGQLLADVLEADLMEVCFELDDKETEKKERIVA